MRFIFWNDRETNKRKSRRPLNTGFRQQRLKAWQPNLSPHSIVPLFIVIACVFGPIGVGLIISAQNIQNLVVRYEQCRNIATFDDYQEIPKEYYEFHFDKYPVSKPSWKLVRTSGSDTPVCRIRFEIPNKLKSSIYVYYKLSNFNQNHRKYIESIDIDQLGGKPIPVDSLKDTCNPLRKINGKAVYPCGLIANSMFNDTFNTQLDGIGETQPYILSNRGISWSTDRHRYHKTKYDASEIVPPPNWAKKFPNGYSNNNIPDLQSWEEFQIWMRAAALPTFYKLALKNEENHLPKGVYSIDIGLNYPVLSFNGTKSFVLTTSHIIGARNISLGIIYLVVAGICSLFAVLFLTKIVIRPKSLERQTYLDLTNDSDKK